VRFPAGQVGALTDHLLALDWSSDQPLICIVESTNGMLDGGLMSAGLRVHRADPWVLPARPAFGSVDAGSLARAGVTRLPELSRLVIESGTLTGRGDEHARWLGESEPGTAALTEAGRCLERARATDDKVIALTFDDGPNPPYTGRILDVLDRYGVPATFFCVGLHASAHTEELARMTEAGHRLANHTWSHPFLPDLSAAELAVQLERTDEALAAVAGELGRGSSGRPTAHAAPRSCPGWARATTGRWCSGTSTPMTGPCPAPTPSPAPFSTRHAPVPSR